VYGDPEAAVVTVKMIRYHPFGYGMARTEAAAGVPPEMVGVLFEKLYCAE
jgi:hypothetical protein